MSQQVPVSFVQQFSDNLIVLAQQKGSRLRNAVMNKSVKGKYAHFERMGAVSAYQITSRHSSIDPVDTPHSRRRVSMTDWGVRDYVDRQDDVRMLIDPKNPYAENMANALGRKMDEVIMAAMLGNASSMDSSDSASNVALPAANSIDEDFGSANSNLTIAKLIEARRILMAADVSPDEELYFVYNASAMAALLNTTQATSADYNSVRALVRGELDTFMGFKFIMSNLLRGTLSSESDPIHCLAFAKSGVGLAIADDINVHIDERPDLNHATQVAAYGTFGAVRIEDEKVVDVQCYQTS